jgi:ubiquinone/menaquinone biosynthesis C-methylase UbiE
VSSNTPLSSRPEVTDYAVGRKGYQDVASYDEKRYVGPANEYKQRVMSDAYTRLLGPLDGKSVLDVGCGTGRGIVEFRHRAAYAVGADASFDMLRFAGRKMEEYDNWSLVRSYAQMLPFAEASFDIVTALNFLHLFRESTQREMIAEMKRVVRPGGVLVLEFDNALQGGILGLYKRYFGTEHGSLPWEIRRAIGDGVRLVTVAGAVYPIVWRAFYRAPSLFMPLERLAHHPPLNRLAHRIYYKLVKA